MNLHEYQAKEILTRYGVAVAPGQVVYSPDEAAQAAQKLGGAVFAVKSQIHAGGRGQGKFANQPDGKGGVRIAHSANEVHSHAESMLGQTLVTKQTGPVGKRVDTLYIEKGCKIAHEFYLSLLVERDKSQIMVMASSEGGMDIETVAQTMPDKIRTAHFAPSVGAAPSAIRKIGFALGLDKTQIPAFAAFLDGLYQCFMNEDAAMLEINPMVLTTSGDFLALDAKMSLDDNALFRHEDTAAMRDETEEDANELEASKYQLNYITLEGEIGCMVNGAGLAMATMDIIKIYGASPANFLDVGGSATAERVQKAFEIILGDTHVKVILVNIFGGIMRCDVIAEGIVKAAQNMTLTVPLVVRLEGTKREEGCKILEESGLDIITAESLDDAAQKAVAALKRNA